MGKFEDDEPSFLDMGRYATNDAQYNEEIKSLKEKEDEENRRRLKEFENLVSESRIDINVEQPMDDDER